VNKNKKKKLEKPKAGENFDKKKKSSDETKTLKTIYATKTMIINIERNSIFFFQLPINEKQI
jgi:hypothetical protein